MKKTIPIEQAIQLAIEQHQAGNLVRAEGLYVEILRQDPGNIDALHLLGVLANQGGQPEAAAQLIGRAISRRDDVALFHYNLAEAQMSLEQDAEAIHSYQVALELDPTHLASYANLANIFVRTKQYSQAEAVCREGLKLSPEMPSLLNNLGTALHALDRNLQAEPLLLQAIASKPEFPEAITNLAMCLCEQGRFAEGAAQFREAIKYRPADTDVHNNLGTALMHLQKPREAASSFETAIDLKADSVEATNNLGSALRAMGQVESSIPLFQKAVEIDGTFVEARANLAAALSELNRLSEALEAVDGALEIRPNGARLHFLRAVILRNLWRQDEGIDAVRRALELEPGASDALTTLGYALLEQGDLDGATDALNRSIETDPHPTAHSNVLMTVNYHPRYSPADLYAMHRRWALLHEQPFLRFRRPYSNVRDPDRKLRIGYVSADFRGHSVAFFLEPILTHQDRSQFEIYGYAQVANFDMSTYRLRTEIDHWRETASKPLDVVDQMIRDDEIDILVDLAGHTAGNMLPVFARKPAPVQINMIGFPSTTGLSAMDYRITDALCDPPGDSDQYNSEKLIRLPHIFWVYKPPADVVDVGGLPADENGFVTFTSVNNFTKVTPQVQLMWADLLNTVPNSRLIIQTSAMNSERTQNLVRDRFNQKGVDRSRVEFRPWSTFGEYMKLLDRSDITLDPFPFNGGTTTCHSLWMGVPVITLVGDRHASRMGLSMMTAIGLSEFVAHTPKQYIEIGKRMAADLPHLRQLRAGMRERLRASPLLDGAGYTRDLEAAFRTVWADWCRITPG